MRTENYDILVLGSGIAGLFYAIKCSAFAKVLVVTKGNIGECNTMYAQGGIAAVFDATDSVTEHFEDTLTAGDGLCDRNAVELLVNYAKQCVLELEQLDVHFNKTQNGEFDLHREGGHSHSRVVHHTDATGKEIENSLIDAVRANPNIKVIENHFAIDLLIEEYTCKGAMVFDAETNETVVLFAKLTMLATGGAGQVYANNTNPAVATGDGFAIAFRAGAQMMNMEFVQFHPTVLYAPGKETFLISEAVRGFGAELKHADGTAFMQHYHPLGSLAPRDIVSRAIVHELALANQPCVYLDLRPFDKQEVEKHFPNIYKRCCAEGLDISKDMIPVAPAGHYMCGGVQTDLRARTSIRNLYCCGEVSCTGVHGANRLASNSLLEGLVFAKQACKDAAVLVKTIPDSQTTLPSKPCVATYDNVAEIQMKKKYLQQLMWQHTGIIRNDIQLEICCEKLDRIKEETEYTIKNSGITKERMELLNLAETSLLITRSALLRTESRGCHFRTDCPEKNTVAADTFIDRLNYEHITPSAAEELLRR